MASKKKTSVAKTILVSILALILGVVVGFVLSNSFFTNDLEFYLIGNEITNVKIGTTYEDKGVVCNYKGFDYSLDVKVTYYNKNNEKVTAVDTSALNTYYIQYKIETSKISSSLIRVVNVLEKVDSSELEINFLMLGNEYAGDCIYIKAGEADILVDAGSRPDSATTIKNYLFDNSSSHSYVSDNKLEYVIATHADQDHIAAFTGSKGILTDNNIQIDTIIEFPQTNKSTQVYKNYRAAVDKLVESGTKKYTALECYNNQNGATRIIELAEGIEIEILYNYYYDHPTKNENNFSVCFMLRRGEDQFLFTGDLENDGNAEELLVQNNDLGEVYLYKLGHHGSKTSSSMVLLNEIKPKVAVATCVAFTTEYTTNTDNTFPTKIAIDNLNAVGTVEHLYVTSMVGSNGKGFQPANGNIVVKASDSGISIECSNTNDDFYTFDIFKQYRSWTIK